MLGFDVTYDFQSFFGSRADSRQLFESYQMYRINLLLSNDPGKVDGNFFCYAATVLSPHRNVLIFYTEKA